MTRSAGDRLEVGVTYRSPTVGPYLWHEFDAVTVSRDLDAIAAARIATVRLPLAWDAFMPGDRAPSPRRMRDLETVLAMARERALAVVPVIGPQSVGDCVLLPAYAVDRRAPRPGVRCVTDARVVDGGPRDAYADPLMLEVQVRWLDALLVAFAGHPAIAAWDLADDPATTVRPRRIAQLAAWAELLGGRVRAQGEECRLTLGQADVTTARAVRLGAVAPHVDVIGLALRPQLLTDGAVLDGGLATFVVHLAQALAGEGAGALAVDVGVASGAAVIDEVTPGSAAPARSTAVDATEPEARGFLDELLQRLVESGVVALHAAAWCDWGTRLIGAPPADRAPWLARLGIVDSTGESKPAGEPWRELAAAERAVHAHVAHLGPIDVDSYYANLPDSFHDLQSVWRDVVGDMPAILD